MSGFYKQLYTKEGNEEGNPASLRHPFPRITAEQLANLNRPFRLEKVWNALKSMQPYKAPGPDSFQAQFFQRFWHLVGPSVMDLVLGVLNGHLIPPDMNHTFLTLISKVENPQTITQFCPIGLYNVTYKLVTKLLVPRLKEILSSVISPTQVSFVPKMQITDNIIVMQEMLHTMRYNKGDRG